MVLTSNVTRLYSVYTAEDTIHDLCWLSALKNLKLGITNQMTGGRRDGRTEKRRNRQTNGQTIGRTNKRTNGWTN